MKMLTVFALLCVGMALTGAAAVPEEEKETTQDQVEESVLFKRSSCSGRWSEFNGRCFRFSPKRMTWAKAERRCLSMGGNLASVHSTEEYHAIQHLIMTTSYDYREAWIGGSDAQQEGFWLWTDGSPFSYVNWCPGEPNNLGRYQHCLQMNFGGGKCWDDLSCGEHRPFACAKNI
ncbi:galactose-specific lectin nattectin-like [Cheilinus undulatus]|uniref:galactose-specific lectin nattectin-like n=1 Tax=Cheilinus undulatus TaxID=241271 RepID=UPI001BD6DF04|nr:galactose-specific lectin nattectin-like [Cheilinus undulatus]